MGVESLVVGEDGLGRQPRLRLGFRRQAGGGVESFGGRHEVRRGGVGREHHLQVEESLDLGLPAGRQRLLVGEWPGSCAESGCWRRRPAPPRAARTGGPAGAARAAAVWVLASQLAVKQGRTEAAGAWAGRAGAAARRCGDPVVALAAAAGAAATPLRRTGRAQEALQILQEARDHLTADSRPTAAELDAAGMAALTAAYTAAQAHLPAAAGDFAAQAEQTALRRAGRPHPAGPGELSGQQCVLYRIGIHRRLGDLDTALAYASRLQTEALPTAERRARAATDTTRTLLDAGDTAGAFAQLRLVELAAPHEARRPAVRALTARIDRRPDLPRGSRCSAHPSGPPRRHTFRPAPCFFRSRPPAQWLEGWSGGRRTCCTEAAGRGPGRPALRAPRRRRHRVRPWPELPRTSPPARRDPKFRAGRAEAARGYAGRHPCRP
ncbi:hypothetical protein [Streptomyces nigrescens]|uniref:hypothetical protein n=1 Tax=Streptomyces nigrescens TaxID=1920 RepID=UPI0036F5D0C6